MQQPCLQGVLTSYADQKAEWIPLHFDQICPENANCATSIQSKAPVKRSNISPNISPNIQPNIYRWPNISGQTIQNFTQHLTQHFLAPDVQGPGQKGALPWCA